MRILVVTTMWPTPARPYNGIFVREQVEALRQEGLEVQVLASEAVGGMRAYARIAADLAKLCRRQSFDVVHAHYGFVGVVTGAVPVHSRRVLTLHGSDVNIAWQRQLSRWAAKRCARVVYVSRQIQQTLGIDGDVIPCGVDLALFRPLPQAEARSRLGLSTDAPVVLFGGAPRDPLKAHPRFVAAMDRLRGTDIRSLELGGTPREDVPWLMAAADLLVLTSLQEGSPQVVKEALACGLPIVSVPVGDVAEWIARLPPCRIVEPDVSALARAIREVASQRARLATPATTLEAISGRTIARRLREVYERLSVR